MHEPDDPENYTLEAEPGGLSPYEQQKQLKRLEAKPPPAEVSGSPSAITEPNIPPGSSNTGTSGIRAANVTPAQPSPASDEDLAGMGDGVEQPAHKPSTSLAESTEKPASQRRIGFVEQYFLPSEQITLKGINESFRSADTKRLLFKSSLVTAGCALTGTGAYLAFHEDEKGETHKVEGAAVGLAGVGSFLLGLLMRGKPLGI